MKIYKSLFIAAFCLSLAVWISSCSNDLESFDEEVNSAVDEQIEPYISAQMQEILSMLDTCSFSTPVPIEVLIPGLLNPDGIEGSDDNKLIAKTRSTDIESVVTGVSNNWTLYAEVPTYIDAAFAANLDLSSGAGTYTVTCMAASYILYSNGLKVVESYRNGDIMGMHPDENIKGYKSVESVPSQRYVFTTYIYRINFNYWYPQLVYWGYLGDYLYNMQWRYYAYAE
ncbi:MAG: hypothetical protein VB074_10060 [Proteiniphilum sp.]|uniref:hypothetical protein n=1 Tax=Proteiniphilum sp. TaxID=1926877 RepID=UPI002B1FEB10|nr:hypothetical protein [Proteiniphilum sp.]MEA5128519.1 hypothetical protein [Proteiniphilum sp.]